MGLFSKKSDKDHFYESLRSVSVEQITLIRNLFSYNLDKQIAREDKRDSKQYEYTDSLISDVYKRENAREKAQIEREDVREKERIEREDAREQAQILRDNIMIDLLEKGLKDKEKPGFKFFGM